MINTHESSSGTGPTFSFYVGYDNQQQIMNSAELADGVVLRGLRGPQTIARMRRQGWEGDVLFDGTRYASTQSKIEPQRWLELQHEAEAARILTPGCFASWGQSSSGLEAQVAAEVDFAAKNNATALIALDRRWLTRGIEYTRAVVENSSTPLAIVLSDRGDPLALGGAVDGLISILRSRTPISLLRCDHGAIGGLAFDARHGSIGLYPANRHLYPPGASGGGKPGDRTVRLFVESLMDWFTAATIAGWSASEVEVDCPHPCCDGRPLARFLDERLQADAEMHNMMVLAWLADHIICAPNEDRRRIWATRCSAAKDRYDRLAYLGVKPSAQLRAWAAWA